MRKIYYLVTMLCIGTASLMAQTPAIVTQTPIVNNSFIYDSSGAWVYDAKVTFFGTVDANGAVDTAYFEYGPTTSYGGTVAASPAIVGGTNTIVVHTTTVIYNCSGDYHCRLKVVTTGGTYYGGDVSFAPEVDPVPNLAVTPNCSDDPNRTSFSIVNNNYFPVSLTCADGITADSVTLNLSQQQTGTYNCNKASTVSFYVNYTNPSGSTVYPFLFEQRPSDNDLCSQPAPSPQNNIIITPLGYNSTKDSVIFKITNNNNISVDLTAICAANSYQYSHTFNQNSLSYLILPGYGQVDFYYNNSDFATFPAPLVKTTYQYTYSYPTPTPILYTEVNVSPLLCYVYSNSVSLDASASTNTIPMLSSVSWEAATTPSWISVNNGTVNFDNPLSFSVQANTTGQARTGNIPISGGFGTVNVAVNQSALALPTQNLKLHLRSDEGVVSSGGTVSEWDDLSGNGNNATQSASANQPVYFGGAISNLPVIRFNGLTSKLTLPTSAALGIQSNPYELFIVARSSYTSQPEFLIAGGTNEQFEYHLNGAAGARFIPVTSTYLDEGTSGTYCDGNAHVFEARASSTGGAVSVDGVDGATSTANILSSNGGNLQLGVRSDGTYYFNGDIAEVILYNAVLSASSRDSVEHYLANRYGITSGDLSLPVQATDFMATAGAASVTLTWKTQSEVDNAGFNVIRQSADWELIASYTSNSSLKGLGTSSTGRAYQFVDTKVKSGATYNYKIQSVNAQSMTTNDLVTLSVTVNIPKAYALYQNYPNPFNPTTAISYQLSEASHVTLRVYDVLGREVAILVDGEENAGVYKVAFNGARYASGVYFYRLVASEVEPIAAEGTNGKQFVAIKKFMLVK
ncbi:MAG: T9SS type A sorting domain-containing protein [Bacteroidetes bacterium]|nr:T9SS type A sorting domain-containing protein [Bacteroidota bacterium]